MLVLTRKRGESIHIAGNIKVTVLDIMGDNIKIGIEAPRNIDIYRSEILQAIQKENQQAATMNTALEDLAKLIKPNKNDHQP